MAKLSPGERVAHWRRLRGLSQAELAKRLDISPPSMCRKEAGDQGLSAGELERVAAILGLSLSDFYAEVEPAAVQE